MNHMKWTKTNSFGPFLLAKDTIVKTLQELSEYYEEDILEYIVTSYINGAHSQVKQLVKEVKQAPDYEDLDLLATLKQRGYTDVKALELMVKWKAFK